MQNLAYNVLGTELEICSRAPLTGFLRDGCCNTTDNDLGRHVVCARMTREFLDFSAARGNDLSSARPEFGFPGLEPDDQWCVCAHRWREAWLAEAAPMVVLGATHAAALEVIDLATLKRHAIDLS